MVEPENVHCVSVHVQTPTHLYYVQMCYSATASLKISETEISPNNYLY